jgi:hypothetical protein
MILKSSMLLLIVTVNCPLPCLFIFTVICDGVDTLLLVCSQFTVNKNTPGLLLVGLLLYRVALLSKRVSRQYVSPSKRTNS